ncbi:MAG TPA: exopolyphosphatase [Bacteroidia bacterium]|nr:exopolyphosphatase [Bacteroidia bacterium]
MRIAVIDCGTNTFHLLIVETKADGEFTVLLKENIPVKLGEAGITNKIISEIPFQRGINTLKNFAEIILKNKPGKVYAYATAAIRNAVNGNDFIKSASEKAGIELQLINGQKEAELIYLGVRQAVKLTEEKVLIMDIGGGSVEFIIANNNEIFWKQSFEIGAAILLEKFNPSDPIKTDEINEINEYLEKELQPLLVQLQAADLKLHTLIGSSGSFETFVDLISWHFTSPRVSEKQTEYEIRWDEFLTIHEQLIHSTTEERLNMKGMVEMRADMIVVASILVKFILEKTKITKMKLSTFALKEGILAEALEPGKNKT